MSDEHGGAGRHHAPGIDDTPLAGGAPVSPDAGWWSTIDQRHRSWLIGGAIAAVVLLAAGTGIAVAVLGSSASSAPTGPGGAITPAVPTTAATEPTLPALPSETTSTTSTQPATAAPTPSGGRAALVAYRLAGAIWVSGETGENPRRVFTSSQGPFSLSPDGATLAIADTPSGTLSLADVATLRSVIVGKAVPERPGWAPDSSFVVYTVQVEGGHDTDVVRVSRDGSGRRTLGPGSGGKVAFDGSVVGVSASRTSSGTPMVVYASSGSSRMVGKRVSVNAVAPIAARIVFADAGGLGIQTGSRPPSLQSVAYDGTGQKMLVGKPRGAVDAFFGDIVASPDGAAVAYTETGDDGYSRLFTVRSAGGTPTALSTRRDDYIVGWNAGGTEIFFIEGNAVQQESTRLMAVHPDGSGRRIVIDGAGL